MMLRKAHIETAAKAAAGARKSINLPPEEKFAAFQRGYINTTKRTFLLLRGVSIEEKD